MKKIALVLLTLIAVTSCTPDKNNNTGAQVPGTVNPYGDNTINGFEVLALGSWVSRDCYPGHNNTMYKQVLTFSGNGQASTVNNIYRDFRCQGSYQAFNRRDFTYTLDGNAATGVRIIINGQNSEMSIQNGQLTWRSRRSSAVYDKVN